MASWATKSYMYMYAKIWENTAASFSGRFSRAPLLLEVRGGTFLLAWHILIHFHSPNCALFVFGKLCKTWCKQTHFCLLLVHLVLVKSLRPIFVDWLFQQFHCWLRNSILTVFLFCPVITLFSFFLVHFRYVGIECWNWTLELHIRNCLSLDSYTKPQMCHLC